MPPELWHSCVLPVTIDALAQVGTLQMFASPSGIANFPAAQTDRLGAFQKSAFPHTGAPWMLPLALG